MPSSATIEVIGEIVKHLPDRLLQRAAQVNWTQITGFRDFLRVFLFSVKRVPSPLLIITFASKSIIAGSISRNRGVLGACSIFPVSVTPAVEDVLGVIFSVAIAPLFG